MKKLSSKKSLYYLLILGVLVLTSNKASTQNDVWTIGIITGDSPFTLSEPNTIKNPVLTAKNVTDFDADIVAHPFVISKDGKYYLFFTVKDGAKDEGGIGLATSNDGIHWKYEKLVVKEPFVQSYPYVFEDNENYYMIPEAHTEKSVRLYKAIDFPTKWKFQKELINGKDFISSSIVKHNEKWWLFSSDKTNGNLNLYFANTLNGTWKAHPKNPIITNNTDVARPAGRILKTNNNLYRMGQDCNPTYGNQVHAFKITELTSTNYKEEIIEKPIIKADGTGWNAKAMHHIDFIQLKDKNWLGVIDAWGTVKN